jgi:adenylate kinase
MKIILLGPPGVGKGTLAAFLKDKCSLAHISTGDMLREEMKKGSPLGLEIKALMEKGALVSDELVTRLVEQKLSRDSGLKAGFMLDGFPRTAAQAQSLDKFLSSINRPIDVVLCLEANLKTILERLTGRRICRKCGALYHLVHKPSKVQGVCDLCGGELYQRSDDNEETIHKRMDVYYASTQPIIDYYAKQNKLKKLNGNLNTVDIRDGVVKILDEYKQVDSH